MRIFKFSDDWDDGCALIRNGHLSFDDPNTEVAKDGEEFVPLSDAQAELVALQEKTVPKFKFDTLVQHCKRLEKDLAQARAEVNEVTLYQENAVWFWQHDGQDYLDSLSCPIIIQPHHLRELLSTGAKTAGTAEHLAKLALDIHLGDDSPDPISKQAFANIVALVKSIQNKPKEQ